MKQWVKSVVKESLLFIPLLFNFIMYKTFHEGKELKGSITAVIGYGRGVFAVNQVSSVFS